MTRALLQMLAMARAMAVLCALIRLSLGRRSAMPEKRSGAGGAGPGRDVIGSAPDLRFKPSHA
ncbi:MAG: hypothetical protein DWQ11_15995 [Proteobacteria bacterium]|nr:MAG: hypothetical protein DWQ11_15995 [Pseudomonadota bacterium]